MLVLSRKEGETLRIGDDISITVVRIQGGQVRIGIVAPRELCVVREPSQQSRVEWRFQSPIRTDKELANES